MTWQLSSELARRVEFSPVSGTKLRSKAPMRNITNVSALLVLSCMRDSRSSLARLELLLIGGRDTKWPRQSWWFLSLP